MGKKEKKTEQIDSSSKVKVQLTKHQKERSNLLRTLSRAKVSIKSLEKKIEVATRRLLIMDRGQAAIASTDPLGPERAIAISNFTQNGEIGQVALQDMLDDVSGQNDGCCPHCQKKIFLRAE